MIGREDFEWWWSFAPTLKWTWARSYAETAPHWWIREGRTPGLSRIDFLRAVEVIRTFGSPGKFFKTPNLYLTNPWGNLKCWAMPGDPVDLDRMHIINLARTDRIYGDQTLTEADSARLDALALPPGRLSSRMGDLLARDLFDSIPEGVPDLDPEDDH